MTSHAQYRCGQHNLFHHLAAVFWYVEELVLGDAWVLVLLAEEPLDGTTAVHRGGRRAPLWVFVPCQCTAAARGSTDGAVSPIRSMHSTA